MRCNTFAVVLLVGGLVTAPSANAAEFCAQSAAEIQAALTAAQSNGEDDWVYVESGYYTLPATLVYNSSEPHSITIFGGLGAGCTSVAFADTTLDGQHSLRPMYVGSASGAIQIAFLTFAAGFPPDNAGGGLLAASDSGDVDVVLNRFIGNRSIAAAGGLYAYSGSGSVRVRNNLLLGNRGGDVGGLVVAQGSGEAYVTGNTIVANTSDTPDDAGGLVVTGNAHFTLSNNIIWNNAGSGGSDFGAASAHDRIANDIGIVTPGSVAGAVSGEQSVDPQFAPCGGLLCFSFELARSSPLVDAGIDDPVGGQTGSDLAFKPRVIGPRVDIGAYENDRLLVDGFES